MMTKIEMRALDAVIGIHREMKKANETDWEKRRYEIAKECVVALMPTEITLEDAAKLSVEQADALIKELRKGKEEK